MKNLDSGVLNKAIEIANALLDEGKSTAIDMTKQGNMFTIITGHAQGAPYQRYNLSR
jgi:hypothetical protein